MHTIIGKLTHTNDCKFSCACTLFSIGRIVLIDPLEYCNTGFDTSTEYKKMFIFVKSTSDCGHMSGNFVHIIFESHL